MAKFTCVKPTAFKGRQVIVGVGITVSDEFAATLEGNDAWVVVVKAETKPKIKTKKAQASKAGADEALRQRLMEQAQALGCKPKANTGVAKLEAMIEAFKRIKPDEAGASGSGAPGSIV